MTRRRLMTGLILATLLLGVSISAALAGGPRSYGGNFGAFLNGGGEIPPNDSDGFGVATFELNRWGTALDYELLVFNIDNVVQAHIHCGGPDVNGPVVAFLFGPVPGGVTVNGELADGVIKAGDVIARPDSPECPGGVADFDDMLDKIESGEAYVNVHTLALPAGEIRGQIR